LATKKQSKKIQNSSPLDPFWRPFFFDSFFVAIP
jgi:hypothetical protein